MALDATVGGVAANSFATLIEASAYFTNRVNASAWTGSDTLKEQALITASQRLDQEDYIGVRQTTTQALKWPRLDAVNYLNEETILESTIPQQLKEATYELALHLLTDTTALDEDTLKAFSSLRLPGGLNLELRENRSSGELPAQVVRSLRGIVLTGTGLLLRS